MSAESVDERRSLAATGQPTSGAEDHSEWLAAYDAASAPSRRAALKRAIVFLAVRRLMPSRIAGWLLKVFGLRSA